MHPALPRRKSVRWRLVRRHVRDVPVGRNMQRIESVRLYAELLREAVRKRRLRRELRNVYGQHQLPGRGALHVQAAMRPEDVRARRVRRDVWNLRLGVGVHGGRAMLPAQLPRQELRPRRLRRIVRHLPSATDRWFGVLLERRPMRSQLPGQRAALPRRLLHRAHQRLRVVPGKKLHHSLQRRVRILRHLSVLQPVEHGHVRSLLQGLPRADVGAR
jgi:hypothetical protein